MRYPRSLGATTRKALALTMVMFCIGAWLAPVAHAQLIGGVLDGATNDGGLLGGGGSSGSTDSGSTDTGSGGGLLGNVVDAVTGGNDSPDSSDSGSSSGSGGLIGGVIDTVDKTVDKVGNTLGSGVDNTVDTVDKTVESTVRSLGGTVGSLPVAGETIKKITKDRDGKSGSKDKNTSSQGPSVPVDPAMDPWEVLGKNYAKVAVDTRDAHNEIVLTSGGSSMSSIDDSVISQIGRIASEAAQQAAFPLILTMLVIAFLTVQNRIDRKDPKLALAPVDSEQDLLSFS